VGAGVEQGIYQEPISKVFHGFQSGMATVLRGRFISDPLQEEESSLQNPGIQLS
jgi:hypothetical protein